VCVTDDVDVRPRMHVDADVAAVAVQAGVDVAAARAQLQQTVVLERVRLGHEVGEDGVVRIVRAPAPERTSREPDDPDQRRPASALERLLDRPLHPGERTGRGLFRRVAPG
jgi:hypothetical protein